MNIFFKENFDSIYTKNKNAISVLNELLQKTSNEISYDYSNINKLVAHINVVQYDLDIQKESNNSNIKHAKLEICFEMIVELIGDREYVLNKLEKNR